MSRRMHQPDRCPRCAMHLSVCICPLLPRFSTRTRVVLLMHALEAKKTTNTGRIAALCLENAEVKVYGRPGEEKPRRPWPEGCEPLLLYPSPGARPIEAFRGSERPIALLVPDGTWQQAKKARKRIEGLDGIPCVVAPKRERRARRLRAETTDEGLSTLEAVARALGVLERPEIEEELERVFRVMVDRTLWTRGVLPPDLVEGGLPAGAQRHDPRSGALAAGRPPSGSRWDAAD